MANSANDLQLRELKDTIKELNTLIRELKDTLKTVREDKQAVTQERDNLKEEVKQSKVLPISTMLMDDPTMPLRSIAFPEIQR